MPFVWHAATGRRSAIRTVDGSTGRSAVYLTTRSSISARALFLGLIFGGRSGEGSGFERPFAPHVSATMHSSALFREPDEDKRQSNACTRCRLRVAASLWLESAIRHRERGTIAAGVHSVAQRSADGTASASQLSVSSSLEKNGHEGGGVAKRAPAGGVLRIDVTSATILKAVLAIAVVWLLLQLWPIVLVIAVALMLVGVLAPPIAWLERQGIRRPFAISAVFLGMFTVVALFTGLTAPSLVGQLIAIVERLPQTQAQIADQLERTKVTLPLAKSLRGTESMELMGRLAGGLLSSSTKIIEVVAYAATSLFLSLYLIIDRDRMRGGLFALVPRTFHVRLSRILLNLETIVGGYMRGQVITSVMMGFFTFVVLTTARVPNAVALAAFAGVADVLPYVGALLACGPAVLAAWSRGLPVALAVLVALGTYQEFESRIIVPRIYGKALRLPAATIMIALLVGGKLMGILGALLALPVAAAIRMVIEELRFELPGEEVDDFATRTRDEREERVFLHLASGARAEQAAAIATEIAEARIHDDLAARTTAAENRE